MNCRFCGSPPRTDWGYHCGTLPDVIPQRTNRCREAEVALLKERIKRLESFAERFLHPEDLGYVANQFLRDDAREALGRNRVESPAKEAKP
jgi:hypothetical protein